MEASIDTLCTQGNGVSGCFCISVAYGGEPRWTTLPDTTAERATGTSAALSGTWKRSPSLAGPGQASGTPPFPFSPCSSDPIRSIGSGNTMVEFLSAAITVSVSR